MQLEKQTKKVFINTKLKTKSLLLFQKLKTMCSPKTGNTQNSAKLLI